MLINTTDGPIIQAAARALTGMPAPSGPAGRASLAAPPPFTSKLPYLSRAAWGADESLRFASDGTELFPTLFYGVQTLTVHHTVTANADPDPAATVRAIYFFHTITEDFGDIGYHLLIDEAGRVYEGRYSGDDKAPVFGPEPGPDGRPQMCNGAHVGGFNAGNVGVALLGDLTDKGPTAAAYRSLTAVLARLAQVTAVDPLAQVHYVNPVSGAEVDINAIAGHQEWAPTQCPGNTFFPQLPQVRDDVATLLNAA